MVKEKDELRAFCNSQKCTGSRTSPKYIEKPNVKGKPFDCPDCGCALKWAIDGKLKNRIVRNQKIKDRETL